MDTEKNTNLASEVERLMKALEHEKRKTGLLLQSMVDGVYTTDLEKRISFWNEGAERITGFDAETAVGSSCKTLLSHTDESGACLCDTACPLTHAMGEDAVMIGKEVYSNTSFGTTLPVSVSCSPIKDENGNIVGAIEVFRDISEKKRLEEQKKRFLQMVTHDLKSPLSSIIGYSDLLLDDSISRSPRETREYLENIRLSSSKMASLIRDFIDVTRLDSAAVVLNRKETSLQDLASRLVDEYAPTALARRIAIILDVGPEVPSVHIDPGLVERAISNLINNAVKYTRDGGRVRVSASCAEKSVEISVSDNGFGIPPDERGRIFDMYHRVGDTSMIEGSGLGLTLVATVAKAHGGCVRVEDGDDGGSRFAITLPMNACRAPGTALNL